MSVVEESTSRSPKEILETAYAAFKATHGARVAMTAESPGAGPDFPSVKVEFLNLKNGQTCFAIIRQTDGRFALYWSGMVHPNPFIIGHGHVEGYLRAQESGKIAVFNALFTLGGEGGDHLQDAVMQALAARDSVDIAICALGDEKADAGLAMIEFQRAINNTHIHLVASQEFVLKQIKDDVEAAQAEQRKPKNYD